MTDVVALIQARVGSTRFPGKVLADIEGSPLLAHVIRRTKAATMVDAVILAIPDTPENDPLVAIGEAEGVRVYRGSEPDVLSRFYWAAELEPDAPVCVRITADDPCKDPTLIDRAIVSFISEWGRWEEMDEAGRMAEKVAQPHYLWLGGVYWPLGLDVEVFTHTALREAFKHAKTPEEREHVTPWIAERYNCWTLKDDQERGNGHMRLTVDTPADLEVVRAIYARCYGRNRLFGYDDILNLQHAEAA